jgi:hypothetical protein
MNGGQHLKCRPNYLLRCFLRVHLAERDNGSAHGERPKQLY